MQKIAKTITITTINVDKKSPGIFLLASLTPRWATTLGHLCNAGEEVALKVNLPVLGERDAVAQIVAVANPYD